MLFLGLLKAFVHLKITIKVENLRSTMSVSAVLIFDNKMQDHFQLSTRMEASGLFLLLTLRECIFSFLVSSVLNFTLSFRPEL